MAITFCYPGIQDTEAPCYLPFISLIFSVRYSYHIFSIKFVLKVLWFCCTQAKILKLRACKITGFYRIGLRKFESWIILHWLNKLTTLPIMICTAGVQQEHVLLLLKSIFILHCTSGYRTLNKKKENECPYATKIKEIVNVIMMFE